MNKLEIDRLQKMLDSGELTIDDIQKIKEKVAMLINHLEFAEMYEKEEPELEF